MSRWKRALVTGASRGIGAAIARRLATDGVDLVLVARDRERLGVIAGKCRDTYGVQVEILDADLTDPAGVAVVEARLTAGEPIDLLVNNAGHAHMGAFARLSVDDQAAVIGLNVTALMRLTHAAVGAMVAAGGGTIVNVSSGAGLQPWPRMATYAGTKAFVNSFSESVHEEVRDRGVTVTAVIVGFARTELSGGMRELRRIPSWLWITADDVAVAALTGAVRGRPVVIPTRRFSVLFGVLAVVPRAAKRRLGGRAARRAARQLDAAAA